MILQETRSPAAGTRPPIATDGLTKRLRLLDARKERIDSSREDALRQLVDDLEWMDISFVRAWEPLRQDQRFEIDDLVHVTTTRYKADPESFRGYEAHAARTCDASWCRQAGVTRWSRGSGAPGFHHHGTYRAIAWDGQMWICIPEQTR